MRPPDSRLRTQDWRRIFDLRLGSWVLGLLLASWVLGLGSIVAAQLPSLFRGVVAADSPDGVRVVSVEESSQAFLADLRPEDILMQVDNTPIGTIDQFSAASQALKGKARKANVVVLRNGQPVQLLVHLYSYPILRRWRLSFIPNDEFRFADPHAGLDYWGRMAGGFEGAGDEGRALDAYLNALHYGSDRRDVAVKIAELFWRIGRQQLQQHRMAEALGSLDQGTVLLEQLFEQPLEDAELQGIKSELEQTVQAIHASR